MKSATNIDEQMKLLKNTGRFPLSALFRRVVKLLHHREHEDRGDDAEDYQNSPYHHQREAGVPDGADDRSEIVADGCGAKPKSHHQALELRRCHLRDERDSHRAEQQLSECQHQISANQPVRRHQHAAHAACRRQLLR